MFSPKVLDRAHVIEFKIATEEMASYLESNKMVNRNACHNTCAGMAEDFLYRTTTCVTGANTEGVKEALNGFFKELKSVNAEFGYRTTNEIYRYINNVGDDLGEHGALDTAILQKLLPKLHGSRKKLSPVLSALWQLCFAGGSSIAIESVKDFAEVKGLVYPTSAEKILRMYRAVVDNGFTSFAEA
jgi:5-methylcytosine-specific restriction protein B